jgi:hypothetical protein
VRAQPPSSYLHGENGVGAGRHERGQVRTHRLLGVVHGCRVLHLRVLTPCQKTADDTHVWLVGAPEKLSVWPRCEPCEALAHCVGMSHQGLTSALLSGSASLGSMNSVAPDALSASTTPAPVRQAF